MNDFESSAATSAFEDLWIGHPWIDPFPLFCNTGICRMTFFSRKLFFLVIVGAAALAQSAQAQNIVISSLFSPREVNEVFTKTLLDELNFAGQESLVDPLGALADVASAREFVMSQPGALVLVPLGFALLETQSAAAAILTGPALFDDFDAARAAQQGPIGDLARSEIRDDRVTILRLWTYATHALVATVPLESAASLEGLTALEGGQMSDRFLQSLGVGVESRRDIDLATLRSVDVAAVEPQVIAQLIEEGIEIRTVVSGHRAFPAAAIVGTAWWDSLGSGQQRSILAALDKAEAVASAVIQEDMAVLEDRLRAQDILVRSWRDFRTPATEQAVVDAIQSISPDESGQIERFLKFLAASRQEGSLQPPRQPEPPVGRSDSRVFFATDRRFDPQFEDIVNRFGNIGDQFERTHCGEFAPLPPAAFGAPVETPVLLPETGVSEGEDCISRMKEAFASGGGRLTLLIHGYANDFQSATKRALAFVRDARLTGPVLVWSWPSKGGKRDYQDDVDAVAWSKAQLIDLLRAVLLSDRLEGIDILAHSMGSRLAANIMRDAWPGTPGVVVLAAADLDRATLRQAVRRAQAAHTAVLVSENDNALWLSGLPLSEPRAGTLPPVFYHSGVDTIDLSAFDDWLFQLWPPGLKFNHSHAFDVPEVVEDLSRIFAGEWKASDRGLEAREIEDRGGTYFTISADP